MFNYPQHAINWMLDVIFPKICLGCNNFTNSYIRVRIAKSQRPKARYSDTDFNYVCKKCFGEINLKNTFECIGCKRQTNLGLTCVFCKKENQIDQLIVAAELSDSLVEKMLKAYKYKFIYEMVLPLSTLAKRRVKKLLSKGFGLFEDSPLLIPVPLHKRRLNERGFNQAGLLAKNIADTYHVFYNDNILTRAANSKHQAEIKAKSDRINNVKNNFTVTNSRSALNRTIILVDDICTTGATLNECAKVLKEGGAKKVIGFVIARGQFKK